MIDNRKKRRCRSLRLVGERQANSSANDIRTSPNVTQSETTISYFRRYIVMGFNNSGVTGFSGYAYSNDRGNTWIDGGEVSSVAGSATSGDPVLSVDSKGRFYYTQLGAIGNNTFIQTSIGIINETTKAVNFNTAIRISNGTNDDKPWGTIGADFNRPGQEALYVAWTDFNTNQLMFSKLSTGTNPQVLIAPQPIANEANFGANVVVDKDGTIYVFYENRAVTPRTLRMVRSTNGGFNFSSPTTVENITPAFTNIVPVIENGVLVNREVIIVELNRKYIRTFEIPSAAIGPDGVIYVVWNDGRNQPTTGDDIYMAYSENKGVNWNLVRVTDNIAHEIQPSVAVDCHGAHIQYTRFDASNGTIGLGNSTFGLFRKTFSLENGLGPETMVSTSFSRVPDNGLRPSGTGNVYTNFDPRVRPFYMGEYNQIIIGPGNTLLHSWSDNRHDPINGNNPDVFFIQTRSTDPLGNSEPCDCDKHHEHHKHHDCDEDNYDNKNKIENEFNPINIFAPQITVKCEKKEHCDYHHRRKEHRCCQRYYDAMDYQIMD